VLVTLSLAVSVLVGVPVLAQPSFTGDVEADFPAGPTILIFVDPGGKDVLVPTHPVPGTSSGWDIKDVRVTYDSATDILYVGLNSYETVGDADTDGNEGLMTYVWGRDVSIVGWDLCVSVYFGVDQGGS